MSEISEVLVVKNLNGEIIGIATDWEQAKKLLHEYYDAKMFQSPDRIAQYIKVYPIGELIYA